MQKKLIAISSLILIFSLFYSNASAQTATNAASRLKEQMQTLQEQKKAAVSKVRDEFKAKLQTIKDQRKKILIERIDAKLSKANTKHTDRFTQVLSNLQTILDKISEDLDKTEAQSAIDAAKLAVENQAAKTYTIQITDETALRLNVGTITSQLRQDLMATHKLVIDAKQGVQALRKDNAIMKKEATNSANF